MLGLLDINAAAQIPTTTRLRSEGLKAHSYGCDVSSDTDVKAVAATVMSEVGIPDIVVNNAVVAVRAAY